ncbi:MAG: sugar ABC transporter ATP-binding protein [Deltaproteobacteria bacterium]|jgi:ribose transport system ATP-binding protein|nr:sugar ABC transporter ATP-binding protein [Deltaproteobacteria bacterium]
MPILEAKNLTKIFPGVVALDSVNVSFEPGRIHCLVGENGAGKSTLIKCLTGVYEPDEGEVLVSGRKLTPGAKDLIKKVAYVPQEIDLFGHMSVAENLFLPYDQSYFRGLISQRRVEEKAVPLLSKFALKVEPDELVKDIPISSQQLLQVARATVNEDYEAILLDEPTTSLTTGDTKLLFEIIEVLKREGKAVIFISHKLEEVFALGDEITVMRNGKTVASSPIDDVGIPEVIALMTGRAIDQNETFQPGGDPGEVLLEVDNLVGERFTSVSFKLRAGEILGFYGLVGAGRSELMQAVFGYLPVYSGKVSLKGRALKLGDTSEAVQRGLVYLPEERKKYGILPLLSITENLSIAVLDKIKGFFGISARKEEALADEIIAAYDVKTPDASKPVRFLSGGNQQKVIIGRSMMVEPAVLVFDEPTKGIDVGTKTEIYRMMRALAEDKGIGIILISSEMEEVRKCSNRLIVLYDGRLAGEFGPEATKDEILSAVIGVGSRASGPSLAKPAPAPAEAAL